MPIYRIRGIDVDFPYDAYDCQIIYMEKVIQSLQEKCNALLESPTGTGKTLCLLCSILAWRKSLGPFSSGKVEMRGQNSDNYGSDILTSQADGPKLPMVVYTSRTHSQLRQVVQELKRTNYRPRMVVLGSREQLCIHDQVRLLHGKAQTNACHYLRSKRTARNCNHYTFGRDYIKRNPHLGDEPIDIEDLVNIGRSCGPCPYYLSRELHKVVDILFAPYNYLIDRSYRDSLSIEWKDSILIFDEAHNLESLCADAASFDLSSGLLTACISESKNCIDLSIRRRESENSNDKRWNPDNFAILRALLLKLEKQIAEVHIESKELGFTRPGPYIYELLADLNITSKTANKLIGIIEEAALLLEEDANGSREPHEMKGTMCRLESMGDILRIIFRDGGTSHAQFYRVHVQESRASAGDSFKGKVSRTLSWWCFKPGLSMEDFPRRGVGSIILTSGTLSPLDLFAQELQLEFPIRLENPHVISSDQIWAGVVPAGPSGYPFNSSYRNRDSPEFQKELGNAIVNFARIVPDGLLVFFPSYYLMEQCIECWKDNLHGNSSTVWERICRHKQPVIEPRQSSLFSSSIDDYMSKMKDTSTRGAVFFAVCRGKVSEGLDFTDHAGRAVVVTGLPFATRTDPKVRLKREYLDHEAQSQAKGFKTLTGEEWYDQHASRAVNQAVGRVIRHCHDYGAIIFCDERFSSSHRQSQISKWIQPHIECYHKFGDIVYSLTRFFRGNLSHASASQPQGSFWSEKKFAIQDVPVEKTGCIISSSFAIDVKMGNTSGQLKEILPANKSSLAPQKGNQTLVLKHTSHLFSSAKKRLIARTLSPCQNSKIIDLTNKSSMDGEISGECIPSCSTKRPKILDKEPDDSRKNNISQKMTLDAEKIQQGNSHSLANSMKQEKSKFSGNKNMEYAQLGSSSLVVCNMTAEAWLSSQANLDVSTSTVSCLEEQAKGSAFLIQVKEKLSPTEYGEFVGYMKALKSKAMKIGPVLQSIVRLFSSQERHPLLRRFKDYIPVKYHSLYDEHCASNCKTLSAASHDQALLL
ncbi:hypothetical protein Nepgr_024054 [Nepenthes gracilis]|uniref:Regulator of telomere elongation helicase 1 homolog n=1 Tax=Nepenthes gracilis TaxID=150966 RepID=A0AAD3T3Z6_NEPGR|nr:hypothetical protein Nepgr_024054 [Nepenthes gracilis]